MSTSGKKPIRPANGLEGLALSVRPTVADRAEGHQGLGSYLRRFVARLLPLLWPCAVSSWFVGLAHLELPCYPGLNLHGFPVQSLDIGMQSNRLSTPLGTLYRNVD